MQTRFRFTSHLSRLTFHLLPLTAFMAAPAAAQSDSALERARKLLESAPLIDGHNDLPWEIRQPLPATSPPTTSGSAPPSRPTSSAWPRER